MLEMVREASWNETSVGGEIVVVAGTGAFSSSVSLCLRWLLLLLLSLSFSL